MDRQTQTLTAVKHTYNAPVQENGLITFRLDSFSYKRYPNNTIKKRNR